MRRLKMPIGRILIGAKLSTIADRRDQASDPIEESGRSVSATVLIRVLLAQPQSQSARSCRAPRGQSLSPSFPR